MRRLNRAVDLEGRTVAEVARRWVEDELAAAPPPRGRSSRRRQGRVAVMAQASRTEIGAVARRPGGGVWPERISQSRF